MRLSNRQKHILRLHGFSAVYAIGPERSITYSTDEQAEALEAYLSNPIVRHNAPPDIFEFITVTHPCRFGFTGNPADNLASTADGWAFHWGYSLLARVWFEGKGSAETVITHMQNTFINMRKSWVDLRAYPGRELLDQQIIWEARDIGLEGMDDLAMLERLEDLEWQIARENMGMLSE